MFLIAIIIGLIIGFLAKGHLSNLTHIKFKCVMLIFASFAVELLAKILLKMNIIELGVISFTLHLITYLLLFIMIFKNKHRLGVKLIGVGTLLNAIVIFANGGMMPIGTYALNYLGISPTNKVAGMYYVATEGTHFLYLADILPIYLWKIGFILSVGDLWIILGIMVLIVQTMTKEGEAQ